MAFYGGKLTWNSPLWSVNLGRWVRRSAILIKLKLPCWLLSLVKLAQLRVKDRFSPKNSRLSNVTTAFTLTSTPSDELRHIKDTPKFYSYKVGLVRFKRETWKPCSTFSWWLIDSAHLWLAKMKSLLTTSRLKSRVTDLVTTKLKTWVSSGLVKWRYLVKSAIFAQVLSSSKTSPQKLKIDESAFLQVEN